MHIKSVLVLAALLGAVGTGWAQEPNGSFNHWVKTREGFKIDAVVGIVR